MRYKECRMYYCAGIAAIFLLKYYYRLAGSGELLWLLAPVAGWVKLLSGCSFAYIPGEGYVNHSLRFFIAPSCGGMQFLIITVAMLFFTFLHRMNTEKKRLLWAACSLISAYGYTIFVNGIRIVLSMDLPVLCRQAGLMNGWLTPEKLHTMIGAAVYFASLVLLYQLTERLLCWMEIGSKERTLRVLLSAEGKKVRRKELLRAAAPLFWYLMFVLWIPALKKIWLPDRREFFEYAVLVLTVCLFILGSRKILAALSFGVLHLLHGFRKG